MNSWAFEALSGKQASVEECILREEVSLLKAPGPSLSILNETEGRAALFEQEFCDG